jgi:hypothetical protein
MNFRTILASFRGDKVIVRPQPDLFTRIYLAKKAIREQQKVSNFKIVV